MALALKKGVSGWLPNERPQQANFSRKKLDKEPANFRRLLRIQFTVGKKMCQIEIRFSKPLYGDHLQENATPRRSYTEDEYRNRGSFNLLTL